MQHSPALAAAAQVHDGQHLGGGAGKGDGVGVGCATQNYSPSVYISTASLQMDLPGPFRFRCTALATHDVRARGVSGCHSLGTMLLAVLLVVVTMPWSLPPPTEPRSLEMAFTMVDTLAPYLIN